MEHRKAIDAALKELVIKGVVVVTSPSYHGMTTVTGEVSFSMDTPYSYMVRQDRTAVFFDASDVESITVLDADTDSERAAIELVEIVKG